MELIADLHFHSKYSRAVSQQMVLSEIARWGKVKGINLMTTSDFTHPLWFREIKANLKELEEGVYGINSCPEIRFILTTEVSSIYNQRGKLRRIHNLIFAPSIQEAEKINLALGRRGNLASDGRPIFGLSARDLAEIVFETSPRALVIPAHIWTPHFSLYGSVAGFDSIDECFGNLAGNIYAIETGLSSDPVMNWRINELVNRQILSFSDAHSGAKLGREVTVFEIQDINKLRYEDIKAAITLHNPLQTSPTHILYTIEFYPEEGKYHYTGHRACNVRQTPQETKKLGEICPVCHRRLTVGVMHRVEELSASEGNYKEIKNGEGLRWIVDPAKKRPPYVTLVPLQEIIAEALGSLVGSQKVQNEYNKLTEAFEGEFSVLLKIPVSEIGKTAGEKIAEGISKVRSGEIMIDPGYDGVFGIVKIWRDEKTETTIDEQAENEEEKEQMSLF